MKILDKKFDKRLDKRSLARINQGHNINKCPSIADCSHCDHKPTWPKTRNKSTKAMQTWTMMRSRSRRNAAHRATLLDSTWLS
jgi:hypothetical protein